MKKIPVKSDVVSSEAAVVGVFTNNSLSGKFG
jgi:hypothetical protein